MSTWKLKLSDIKHSDYFRDLIDKVNALYREKVVYPPKRDIFKALELTPYEKVKIVILGQDPYHQPGQAMGLSFSVPEGVRIPPSLQNIHKELASDLGIKRKETGDLTGWAKQGVLLLNTTLTVERSKPGAHRELGWERFTDEVIRALDEHESPLVFLLWGVHARKKKRLVTNPKHLVLEASHPSPFSARDSFFGCRHFSKANRFLEENGREPIDFSR